MRSEFGDPAAGPGTAQAPLLITADEVAAMLDISTRTLWRLVSARKVVLPVKLGGSTRWRLAEVESWVASGCPIPALGPRG